MAEILLRVVDKTNPEKGLDALCTKRGDVIAVQPDGWKWGSEELKSDVWRIVKMPGVDPDSLADLMDSEYSQDGDGNRVLVRKRTKQIAVDKLDALLTAKIDESKAGETKAVVELKASEVTAVLAAREVKPSAEIVKVG